MMSSRSLAAFDAPRFASVTESAPAPSPIMSGGSKKSSVGGGSATDMVECK